jgi:hypothetical protein
MHILHVCQTFDFGDQKHFDFFLCNIQIKMKIDEKDDKKFDINGNSWPNKVYLKVGN